MDLEAEVDLAADRLADRADDLDGAADHRRWGLPLEAREHRRRPQRGVARLDLLPGALRELSDGAPPDVREHPDPVSALPAEQLVDWLVSYLAEDVPECDVDRAHRRAEDRAHEVSVSGDDLEVVLDPGGILADVVLGQLFDRVVDQLVVGPEPGLSRADNALVGVDPDEEAPVHQEGRDPLDLHRTTLRIVRECWVASPLGREMAWLAPGSAEHLGVDRGQGRLPREHRDDVVRR